LGFFAVLSGTTAFCTNLVSPNWQPAGSILMTNLWQNFNVDQTKPQIFYRAQ